VEKFGELVLKGAQTRQMCQKAKTSRRQGELARLDRQLQELIRMETDGLLTDKEFLGQKSMILERRIALESVTSPQVIHAGELRNQLRDITEPLCQLRTTWLTLDLPYRQRFERLVLPAGFVNGKHRTAELGLLFQVFGALAGQKAHEAPSTGERWNQLLREIREIWEIMHDRWHGREGSEKAVPTDASE
jgi:hypothetical protein